MSTCKDCLHINVCKDYASYDKDSIISCDNFKNKADYAPAVRCENCAYFYAKKQDEDFPYFCLHHSGPMRTAPNYFCNYGKRKEDK